MHSPHWTICCACALSLASLSGCCCLHQPCGPCGPAGIYSTPPGGTVIPGGQTLPPGSYSQPDTFSPQLPDSGTQPDQWQQSPDGGGDAPFYDPLDDGTNSGGGEFVPEYGDPQDLQPPPQDYNSGAAGDGFDSTFNNYDAQATVEDEQGVIHASADDSPSDGEEDGFQPPIAVQPVSATQESSEPKQLTANAGADPYAYDRENYRWLRGTVEYDEQDGAWHIMYATMPDEADEFGGDIALKDDEKLALLKAGEVVLVEGEVDYDSRDSYGKPMYHVQHVARLIPQK